MILVLDLSHWPWQPPQGLGLIAVDSSDHAEAYTATVMVLSTAIAVKTAAPAEVARVVATALQKVRCSGMLSLPEGEECGDFLLCCPVLYSNKDASRWEIHVGVDNSMSQCRSMTMKEERGSRLR